MIPSKDQLKQTIESGDDRKNNVLVLLIDGKFGLREVPSSSSAKRKVKIVGRYETFIAGNGYVGPEASADDKFIDEVYSVMCKFWTQHVDTGKTNMFLEEE